jgi:hypothetical protein
MGDVASKPATINAPNMSLKFFVIFNFRISQTSAIAIVQDRLDAQAGRFTARIGLKTRTVSRD